MYEYMYEYWAIRQLGVVKKVGSGCFKIVHEKYRAKNADDEADQYQRKFQEVLKIYPELRPQTLRAVVRMTIYMYVCSIFKVYTFCVQYA